MTVVIVGQIAIILLFGSSWFAVSSFAQACRRSAARLGPLRAAATRPRRSLTDFSRVYARAMTIFTAPADAPSFHDLKAFLRHGTVGQPALMRIYRVAGCKTEIEIPVGRPDYERIDAAEALALLRELPDPRLIRRLHLSDEPLFPRSLGAENPRPRLFPVLATRRTSRLVVSTSPIIGSAEICRPHSPSRMAASRCLRIAKGPSTLQKRECRRAASAAVVEPINFGVRENTSSMKLGASSAKGFSVTTMPLPARRLWPSPVHAMIVWRRVERYLAQSAGAVPQYALCRVGGPRGIHVLRSGAHGAKR